MQSPAPRSVPRQCAAGAQGPGTHPPAALQAEPQAGPPVRRRPRTLAGRGAPALHRKAQGLGPGRQRSSRCRGYGQAALKRSCPTAPSPIPHLGRRAGRRLLGFGLRLRLLRRRVRLRPLLVRLLREVPARQQRNYRGPLCFRILCVDGHTSAQPSTAEFNAVALCYAPLVGWHCPPILPTLVPTGACTPHA